MHAQGIVGTGTGTYLVWVWVEASIGCGREYLLGRGGNIDQVREADAANKLGDGCNVWGT